MRKIESFNKKELIRYCESIGVETKNKVKSILLEEAQSYEVNEIKKAIEEGKDLELLTEKINILADDYSSNLEKKIEARQEEMREDDDSHYLIYRLLGISSSEGSAIDLYQNKGRFLYKYAGSFLEEAASLCLKFKNVDGKKTTIPNNQSGSANPKPKTFEIDFLDGQNAIEIKWRDATTDGDHKTKEHTRIKAIESHGYTPIRIMFYYPQRAQAIKIQNTLQAIYEEVNGQYYKGEDAWEFLKLYTGYNLKQILTEIDNNRTSE